MNNIAISIDLNSTRLTKVMLERIVYDLSAKYSTVKIMMYNYSAQKESEIGGIKNVIYLPVTTGRRKVMIDMRQAADMIELACSDEVSTIFVICGMLDSDSILDKVISLGKGIIVGCQSKLNIPYEQYLLSRNINNNHDDSENHFVVSEQSPIPQKSTYNCNTESRTTKSVKLTNTSQPPKDNKINDTDIDNQLEEINKLIRSLS